LLTAPAASLFGDLSPWVLNRRDRHLPHILLARKIFDAKIAAYSLPNKSIL
jgi:hypothetical protein